MKLLADFLKQVIDLLSLQASNSQGSDKEETITAKNAYEWFLKESKDKNSKRVEKDIQPTLLPGKIYVFKYNAKYKNILDFWDKHPIVLVLGNMMGDSGKIVLGLNISWYPPPARKFIVEKIKEIYASKYKDAIKKKGFQAVSQAPVYLDLYQLKNFLDAFGFSFAIRKYIPTNILAPKYCICYEDWDKAILLDQPRIFPELEINNPKFSLQNIYEEFKFYVRDQKQNRAIYKAKLDDAKKAGKLNFIK